MSEAADQKALAIREDIRLVLASMEFRYPNYRTGQAIFMSMLGTSVEYTKQRLIRDLTYLHEKGYVKFKGLHGIEAMSISVNDCAFALTASGHEVAVRLVSDPALDI